MPASDASRLLTDLARSHAAHVTDINLPEDDALRLKTLGLCVGRSVELIQNGDPLVIRVAGANIGLSRRLAHGVSVSDGSAES